MLARLVEARPTPLTALVQTALCALCALPTLQAADPRTAAGFAVFVGVGLVGTLAAHHVDLPGRLGKAGALATPLGAAVVGGLLWWAAASLGLEVGGFQSHDYAADWWGPVTVGMLVAPVGAGIRGVYALARALTVRLPPLPALLVDIGASGTGFVLGLLGAGVLLPLVMLLNFSV